MKARFLPILCQLVLRFQDVNLTVVSDPCPKELSNRKHVVTMCKAEEAYEESGSGSSTADSVVIRVIKQQDKCLCTVGLNYYTKDSSPVYVQAYNQYSSSAPASQSCGLHLDLNNSEKLQTEVLLCNEATRKRTINLARNGNLKISSKLADGSFIYGYCLQIYRLHNENPSTLWIKCNGNQTKPIGKYTSNNSASSLSVVEGEENQVLYIVIGACTGSLVIILVVILLVIFKRKRNLSSGMKEKPSSNDTYGLKNNVFYIPSNDSDQNNSNIDSNVSSNETTVLHYNSIDSYSKGDKNPVIDEGNYSSVKSNFRYQDNEDRITDNEIDGNYSTINLENSQTNNSEYKHRSADWNPKPSSKPKSKEMDDSSCSKNEHDVIEELDKNAAVYAAVNKKTPVPYIKHVMPEGSTDEYAVITKEKQQN